MNVALQNEWILQWQPHLSSQLRKTTWIKIPEATNLTPPGSSKKRAMQKWQQQYNVDECYEVAPNTTMAMAMAIVIEEHKWSSSTKISLFKSLL